LGALGECGFDFDFLENGADWSAEQMKEYPVVIFTKSDNISAVCDEPWVTDEVQRALVEYVENGGGLLVIHSGTAGYLEKPVIRGLMGGAFTTHPEQCPVTIEPKEGHPITRGCTAFTAMDEHYFMEFDPRGAELFLTTTSEHGTMPGGWTRIQGEGRVCVITPGHNIEVWRHPTYQKLLINALYWCSKF
jgi:type 1 glutamine amidotransferase